MKDSMSVILHPEPGFDFFVKPSLWNTHSFLLQMTSWKMLSFSVFVFFYIRGRRQCAAEAVWLSATLFLPLNPLSKGRCHCNVPKHHQYCIVRAPTQLCEWISVYVFYVHCTLPLEPPLTTFPFTLALPYSALLCWIVLSCSTPMFCSAGLLWSVLLCRTERIKHGFYGHHFSLFSQCLIIQNQQYIIQSFGM